MIGAEIVTREHLRRLFARVVAAQEELLEFGDSAELSDGLYAAHAHLRELLERFEELWREDPRQLEGASWIAGVVLMKFTHWSQGRTATGRCSCGNGSFEILSGARCTNCGHVYAGGVDMPREARP